MLYIRAVVSDDRAFFAFFFFEDDFLFTDDFLPDFFFEVFFFFFALLEVLDFFLPLLPLPKARAQLSEYCCVVPDRKMVISKTPFVRCYSISKNSVNRPGGHYM